MKYLIFSDLHGAVDSIEFLIERFKNLKCDQMICLGDVLYHGPRNDLPMNYNPKRVIEIMNDYKDFILCIQGNCDAEVDQMVLNFSLHQFLNVQLNGIECHLEHGHHLESEQVSQTLTFYGHTHVSCIEEKNGKIFANPGSITIPKNNTKRSYMILENHHLSLYDNQDNLLQEKEI
ncbi:MAG: phosphodiesterase [Anaeroplasmataceae bacterium]|nr:phosphodiesterase [Anaeroplasmataceae bacterium]